MTRRPDARPKDWSVVAVLLFCLLGSLTFLAVVDLVERGMCAWHSNEIRYCPGYFSTQKDAR